MDDVRSLAYGNLRKKLLAAAAIGAIMIAMWIADALGFPIIHMDKEDSAALKASIFLGIIVVIGLWALVAWRRAHVLSRRGVIIDGTVTAKSVLKKYGECPTTVTYVVNGSSFTKRKDMSSSLSIGTPVRVLYDARNPARAEILDVTHRLSEKAP